MSDSEGPAVDIDIWYPTASPAAPRPIGPFIETVATNAQAAGDRLPLVVISHGNGGASTSHIDTALALARAGFVTAAITHTGDNYRDQSRAADMANRSRQLKRLVDYLLGEWPQHAHIDPKKIGAFGFSSGGFTVLVAAGGEPDLSAMAAHCRSHPDYYDCRLTARAPAGTVISQVWVHDTRLKAVVSAAPALGFTFGKAGLSRIEAPIQLWRAAEDHILPNPDYAEAVKQSLPKAPEYHVVPAAGHYDFLAPCSDILRQTVQEICSSANGFDRAAFHAAFNREVVSFFKAKLSVR
jgi:predicted dienelactone hydrolase